MTTDDLKAALASALAAIGDLNQIVATQANTIAQMAEALAMQGKGKA